MFSEWAEKDIARAAHHGPSHHDEGHHLHHGTSRHDEGDHLHHVKTAPGCHFIKQEQTANVAIRQLMKPCQTYTEEITLFR